MGLLHAANQHKKIDIVDKIAPFVLFVDDRAKDSGRCLSRDRHCVFGEWVQLFLSFQFFFLMVIIETVKSIESVYFEVLTSSPHSRVAAWQGGRKVLFSENILIIALESFHF